MVLRVVRYALRQTCSVARDGVQQRTPQRVLIHVVEPNAFIMMSGAYFWSLRALVLGVDVYLSFPTERKMGLLRGVMYSLRQTCIVARDGMKFEPISRLVDHVECGS